MFHNEFQGLFEERRRNKRPSSLLHTAVVYKRKTIGASRAEEQGQLRRSPLQALVRSSLEFATVPKNFRHLSDAGNLSNLHEK